MTWTSFGVIVAGLVCTVGGSPGFAQTTMASCTFDQMQGDPQSVIAPCTAVLDDKSLADEARAEALHVRGRAYARTSRIKLAAQDYDVALKLAPTRGDIYVSRSNAEYKLGNFEGSWADLNRALTLNPRDARAYRAMGQTYQNGGNVDEAITLYGRALAIDPAEPYALQLRSQLYAIKHEFKEALADATALVAIPAGIINRLGFVDGRGVLMNFHVVALDNRAQLFEKIGDHAAAEKDFDAALAEKRSADTLTTRAAFLIREGRAVDALKDIDEAIQLDATDGDSHLLRGLALLIGERYGDALPALDKAIELHKADRVAREKVGYDLLMRARTLRGLARTDEATDAIATALWMSPDLKASTLISLSSAGYWTEPEAPAVCTPAFRAALRACMIDKDCS